MGVAGIAAAAGMAGCAPSEPLSSTAESGESGATTTVKHSWEVKPEPITDIAETVDAGRVVGAVAKGEDGVYRQYNAGKGVVLCTGDLGGNEEMVETFPRCPCAPTVFSTCPTAATTRWAIKWPSGAAPTSSMVLPLP